MYDDIMASVHPIKSSTIGLMWPSDFLKSTIKLGSELVNHQTHAQLIILKLIGHSSPEVKDIIEIAPVSSI